MGPPRSVVMRSTINNGSRTMMRPPMGSNYRPLGMGSLGSTVGLHRRGTTTRGRISHYRSDGRRGMLNTRMIGSTHHRRLDMRPPMSLHNRRYPSLRGRGDGRSRLSIGTKRTYDTTKVSRGLLIKRALQAAKDLDDDALSDNDDEEDEDDEDDDAAEEDEDEPTPKKVKKAPKAASDEEEEDADDKDGAASGQADSGESTKKKEDKDADTTVSTIADGDESASAKKTLVKKKVITSGGEKTAAEDRKSSAADGEDSEKRQSRKITTKYRTSTFIKLNCVHCNMNYVTFKEYQIHLYSRQHKLKMREVFDNCNARVLEMRAAQRNAQKDEDQKSEDGDGEGKTTRASFCIICKLNYRQPRATHQQSEAHKQMKKYLMPFCTVCRISCRSPIAYENHRVSLDHLKNKARVERYSAKVNEDTDDDTQVDLGELVTLGNLTTVDEVGKVDELCEATGGTAESSAASGAAKKRREIRAESDDDDDDDEDDDDDNGDELQMIIGEEHVKKVEVQYCELCNIYLPRRMESQEKALRDHCKKRSHLKLYIRYRNDKKLREKAERIHKKKLKGDKEAANAKKDDEKTNTDTNEGGTKSVATAAKNTTVSTSAMASAAADKKNETTGSDSAAGATKDASTGKGNAEGSSATAGSAEGGKNTAGTGGAANSSASQAEDQSEEIWQVVDNDELGDLLRGVAEVDEDDDDKETMLERYDKFRHTEKNGIEPAAAVVSGNDAADSAISKAAGSMATNGGGNAVDTATNGDTSNSKEAAKVEG
uniref:U1-type domain-containing protein n=1 Tax=Anopheles braziliensis TaxID=58242 RepID=A0A2M3Z239_9DIPT